MHQAAPLEQLRLPGIKPKRPLLRQQLLAPCFERCRPQCLALLVLPLVPRFHGGEGQRRGLEGPRLLLQLLQRPVLLTFDLHQALGAAGAAGGGALQAVQRRYRVGGQGGMGRRLGALLLALLAQALAAAQQAFGWAVGQRFLIHRLCHCRSRCHTAAVVLLLVPTCRRGAAGLLVFCMLQFCQALACSCSGASSNASMVARAACAAGRLHLPHPSHKRIHPRLRGICCRRARMLPPCQQRAQRAEVALKPLGAVGAGGALQLCCVWLTAKLLRPARGGAAC